MQLETEKNILYMVIENSRDGKVKNKENYEKRETIRGLDCFISKPCTKRYKPN